MTSTTILGTEALPRGRYRADGVTVLTAYVLLLLFVPSKLIVKQLGGAGTPATILGLAAAAWWCWQRLHAAGPRRRLDRVSRFALVLLAAALASYVAGTTRVIRPEELRGSQQGLLGLVSWIGVLLVAAEGTIDGRRIVVLLRRFTYCAAWVAVLGLVQFVTKKSWVDQLSVPGLSWNTADLEIADRNGFARPAGTATHSIEFGLVMAILLPFAIQLALDRRWAGPLRRWFPVFALSLAIPIAISRSAIIATGIVVFFLVPSWSPTVRRGALAAGGGLLVFIFLTVHGLLGTIKGLFTNLSNNASIGSRTDSYSLAFEVFQHSPVVGRGLGTFNSGYRILDNQYLALLIDTGVIGLVSLLALLLSGVFTALRARATLLDESMRSLAPAAAGSIAAAAVGYAFFDGFAFPMFAGTTFLLLGVAAALGSAPRRVRP